MNTVDLWDVLDGSIQSYNLALHLNKLYKINSILVDTDTFEHYLDKDDSYFAGQFGSNYVNNVNRLGLLYVIAIEKYKTINYYLTMEYYDYLDVVSDMEKIFLLSITYGYTKSTVNYFANSYLSNHITLVYINDMAIRSSNMIKYHIIRDIYLIIADALYNKKANLEELIESIINVENINDIASYSSALPFIFSKYTDYSDFSHYYTKRCYRLFYDNIISATLIRCYILSEERFEEFIGYYLKHGFKYRDILNDVIRPYSCNDFGQQKRHYIIMYLVEKSGMSIKELYDNYNKEVKVKAFLDSLILNQI